jgi:hypothetical protein
MKTLLTVVLSLMFCTTSLFSSIFCPSDVTISCAVNPQNTHITGKATLAGQHFHLPLRYTDVKSMTNCKAGTIERTWFGDKNNNGVLDDDEPFCIQIITIIEDDSPIIINWPADITVSCLDDVPTTRPEWTAGPCDVLGYTSSDHIFTIEGEACYVIKRKFVVKNWCESIPELQEKWEYFQNIKIVDKTKPIINDCNEKVIPLNQNCEAEVILSNSAFDPSSCSSAELLWIVEVDLWGNGITDYRFAYDAPGNLRIAPTSNDETFSIRIPEKLKAGRHKVKWTVRDYCGNFQSCQTQFFSRDLKAPTPYCYAVLSSTFNKLTMESLEVPARIFNLAGNSFDNCSKSEKLKFSYSPDVEDTIRSYNCDNIGFQFFFVYATDEAGNQDFCEVVFLVFDNGTCNAGIDVGGRVESYSGGSIADVSLGHFGNGTTQSNYISDERGILFLENMPLYDDMYLLASVPDTYPEYPVDIADFVILQEKLLGIHSFDVHQNIMADLNLDGIVNFRDLQILRSILMGTLPIWPGGHQMRLIPRSNIDLANEGEIPGEKLTPKTFVGHTDFTGYFRGQLAHTFSDLENRSFINFVVDKTEIGATTKYQISPETDLAIKGIYAEVEIQNEALIPEIHIENESRFDMNYTEGKMVFMRSEPGIIKSSEELLVLPSEISIENIRVEMVLQNKNSKDIGHLILRNKIQDLDIDITMAPNPATDFVQIIASGTEKAELLDVTGRLLMTEICENESNTCLLNLATVDSGIYIIRIFSKSGHITKKLIVNK